MNDLIKACPEFISGTGKKVFTVAVVFTTIFWSMGLVGIVGNVSAATLTAGDLIKAGGSAVYYYGADGKRYVFPNEKTYKTWYKDFTGVKTITDSELAAISIGGNVTYRSGTRLAKITTDPKVYAVEPGGKLRWVKTEAIATDLFGSDWAKQIDDVPDAFFVNYTVGSEVASSAPTTGSLVKSASSADVYYVDGTGKKKVSATGLDANRFRSEFVRTVSDTILNSLSAGSEIVSAESTLTNTAGGAAVTTGTGLTAAIASDTPGAAIIPDGSANVPFTKVKLTASSDGAISITGIKVTRTGVSLDSNLDGVKVRDSAGKKHGATVTVGSGVASISMAGDPINVAAGQSETITVEADINSGANTGSVALGIKAASDITTSAVVNGTFPITGNTMSITDGQNTLGVLQVDTSSNGYTAGLDVNSTDNIITGLRFNATSNEAVSLSKVTLTNRGSVSDSDYKNIKWIDNNDGTTKATVASATSGKMVFEFNPAISIAQGTTKTYLIRADIASGSTRTVQFVINEAEDVVAKGASTGMGIIPTTYAAGSSNDNTASAGTFPIGDLTAASVAINSHTINQGSLSLALASGSVTNYISRGVSSEVGTFDLIAAGEDIEVRSIYAGIAATDTGASTTAVSVLGLYNTTGTALASTSTNLDPPTIASATYNVKKFTLSPYLIIKAGTTSKVVLKANLSASSFASGDPVRGIINGIDYRRIVSNTTATIGGTGVTAAEAAAAGSQLGNSLTIATTALSVSLDTAVGATTIITGTQNQTLGSFILSAGPAEAINVATITVGTGASNTFGQTNTNAFADSFVKQVKLVNMSATGTPQIGTTTTDPTSAITFSTGGLSIPKGGNIIVKVVGNISSNATTENATILQLNMSASGSGADSSASVSSATQNGQGHSISTTGGSLTIATDSTNNPAQQILHTGETAEVLRIKLTASVEDIMVNRLVVSAAGGAGQIASLGLYKTDSTQVGSSVSLVDGLADFAGFSISVKKNDSVVLILKVTTSGTGTMNSNQSAIFGVIRAEGSGTTAITLDGTTAARSLARTTTWTATAVSATTTAGITVGSNTGFTTGDVVFMLTDNATAASEFGMVTATSGTTTLTVIGRAALGAPASAGRVTKVATVQTTTWTATAITVAGAAVTVGSTVGFTPGDLVMAYTDNATAQDVDFGVVTAVGSATGMTVAGFSAVAAPATTGRISKIATVASTTWGATGGSLTVDGSTAQVVGNNEGFAVGDIVAVFNPTNGGTFGLVSSVNSANTTGLTIVGNDALAAAASGYIIKLPTSKTTTWSATATTTSGAAITVANSTYLNVGDIVNVYTNAATDDGNWGIVTAVGSGTAATVATIAAVAAPASSASPGQVSKLFGATSESNAMTFEDSEPVVALDAASPAAGAGNISAEEKVAVFAIKNDGQRTMTLTSVKLAFSSNITLASTATIKLKNETTGNQIGTNGTLEAAALSTQTETFSSLAVDISSGDTLKLGVYTDSTGFNVSNTVTETFAIYLNGTKGKVDFNNGLTWQYSNAKPTATSVTGLTISDSYPVYANTKTY